MKNVLMAWEIGDGHGHIRNLLAVADLLRAASFHPIFAIPSLQVTAAKLAVARGYSVIKMNLPPHTNVNERVPTLTNYRAASFVDVLGIHALDSSDRLGILLDAYTYAIKNHRIDLVVSETAPIATLSCNILGIPCIGVGTSFGLPEVRCGFAPYFQLDASPLTPLFQDQELLNNIERSSGKRFDKLSDGFSSSAIHPFCFPSMDHYGNQRSLLSRGVGPIWKMTARAPSGELRGFAYINRNYPSCNELVSAIRVSGIPFTVFVRNGGYRSSANMVVVDSFNAEEEISKSSFVLHHGSAGIGQAAMSAGVQQVCLPYHIENINNAYRLQMLGISRAIGHQEHQSFLEFLIDAPDLTGNAQAVAHQLAKHANEFNGAAVAAQSVQNLMN